jgi:hypothetical protein
MITRNVRGRLPFSSVDVSLGAVGGSARPVITGTHGTATDKPRRYGFPTVAQWLDHFWREANRMPDGKSIRSNL